ncbi:uncharacterized protein [Phyllobates terribilis]|uniref:uncharacterized protein n=1 Tax=Phyllobates terribilis TaxID=111132 RepID=UPI003CCB1200
MGKHGKKEKNHQRRHKFSGYDDGAQEYPEYPPPKEDSQEEEEDDDDEEEQQHPNSDDALPSKFLLYQQSVQSPKGDISYLQKFFLMYVGGRMPLHLQEDFCGTAFLSTEWIRGDPRKTAVGLDFDIDALNWCLENNANNTDTDSHSRIFLFHGNVLQPHEAKLVKSKTEDLIKDVTLRDRDDEVLPPRDIVCAFNYSCCCLHKRKELISYFKHCHNALSTKGGIFVMDLYGGTSSEQALKLKRKFPNFTYTWEQEEFDIIERKTRISLHYQLHKSKRKIRHAFSYSWRLWSLPEIKDCLEESGFKSVHFWIKEMPNVSEMRSTRGFGAARDDRYEEVSSFQQQDAWNAYIVAVA